jgi:hypothetical protein
MGLMHNMDTMKYTPCYGDHCNWKCSFNNVCAKKAQGKDISNDILKAQTLKKEQDELAALERSLLDEDLI